MRKKKETQEISKPICNHQFFKINDEIKYKIENMQSVAVRWGVKVMCVLCGEQRVLWTDGEVETL